MKDAAVSAVAEYLAAAPHDAGSIPTRNNNALQLPKVSLPPLTHYFILTSVGKNLEIIVSEPDIIL